MALGDLDSNPSNSQLQHASRKVESVGFAVGQRLVERYTKERPRFTDSLEIIKFICKDFWVEVYRKQIDKLQTNNRVRLQNTAPPHHHHRARNRPRPPANPRVAPRAAGRVHAAGQLAPDPRALLALRLARRRRQADGRRARQVPGRPHPRSARRAGGGGLGLGRGLGGAALPVHDQDTDRAHRRAIASAPARGRLGLSRVTPRESRRGS